LWSDRVLKENDEIKSDYMNRNITYNDLLLLAYNELDTRKKLAIFNTLQSDSKLMSEFQEILDLQGELDQLMLQPNPTSLQIILEESSSAMEVL
jgi:hypothetical protein